MVPPPRLALALVLLSGLARADDSSEVVCNSDRCLDIELFTVVTEGNDENDAGGPGDARWIDQQVRHANKLFAPAGTGFRVATRRVVAGPARVRTRRQRDAFGRHSRNPAAISVFLVRDLDDVDTAGRMLRGVHWRRRGERAQTWIILSTLDDTGAVLAHELGHYFGLRHSRARNSVMNKAPHDDPPFVERVFTPAEVDALRAGVRARFSAAAPAAE